MVESLVQKNLKISIIKEGVNTINLGKNTRVTVYSPKEEGYEDNLNEYSAVIKIQYGNTKFLFTGDAEKSNEFYILNKGYDIKADVLKVAHHGSNTSTSESFYRAVNPSITVMQLGEDNSYNQPHRDTISLLNKYKPLIFRTDKNGTIVLTSDGYEIDCYTSK
jgi:competence protein ComEC